VLRKMRDVKTAPGEGGGRGRYAATGAEVAGRIDDESL